MTKMENVDEILPLSPVQTGMLFETVSETSAPGIYVAVVTINLIGPIDPDSFEQALNTTARAHDALRASFIWEAIKQPVQLIANKISVPFTYLDWSKNSSSSKDLEDLITNERHQGFDLKKAPLMRGTLIRMDETHHKFVWTVHHLIADGWSAGLLINEILERHHEPSKAISEQPSASFRDYLAWMKSRDISSSAAFWRDYLEDADTSGSITIHSPKTPQIEHMHKLIPRELPHDLVTALKEQARRHRVTLATLLSTAWALVLRRYSGRNDVIFGQTNAGRPTALKGVQNTVGAFVNTLPVRLKFDPQETLAKCLINSEAEAISRRSHELTSLTEIHDHARIPRGQNIFDTVFVFEDFPTNAPSHGDVTLENIERLNSSTYPLTILVVPDDPWRLEAMYDPQELPLEIVQAILSDYQDLLASMPDANDQSIKTLTRQSWAKAPEPEPSPTHPLILDQIARWAQETPQKIALSDQNEATDYAQLEARSNRIAAALQKHGITRGDIVPIALERTGDVVAAMLGVLKTGAAYTPLDLDYPADRLAQTIHACAPKAIVTSNQAALELPESNATPIFMDARGETDQFSPVAISPDDLAYVIFTSGSSGTPKGVMISHANLAYSTGVRQTTYPKPPETFLMMSSFAFDSSVVGIYWTLSNGGHLVISKPHAEQDLIALGQTLKTNKVSHLLCLPSLYQALLTAIPGNQLESLNTVIVAGETILPATLKTHQETLPETSIFNEYGPTEGTVWCAASDLSKHRPSDTIPIGHAPDGTTLQICDPDGNHLPQDVIGEITIFGPGVAQGYLNAPEATDQAFLMGTYKTGDLGYAQSDGKIIFLGRRDDQIKIRGHRIELEDVQANIAKITGFSDLAVIAINEDSSHQLACLIATDPTPFDPQATKRAIAGKLPAHMVPSTILAIPEMPRLPNGKTDVSALEHFISTEKLSPSKIESTRPTTFTEKQLIEVWKDTLNLSSVSPDDDFFELGGDSLKTIAASLRAEEAGLNIAPYQLFEFPKLRDLANHLHFRAEQLADTTPDANLAHANDTGTKPIFFMIHGSLKMYSYLSATLGKDRPLGFLFSHFFGGDISPRDRIETLTDEAMARLKALKPEGPYHLGGYSLGGIIALELAHRLRSAGETVEILFLLDPSYDVRNPEGFGSDRPGTKRHGLHENLRSRTLMALATIKETLPGNDKQRAHLDYVGNAYRRILTYYRPPVYEGETVIMTSTTTDTEQPETHWQSLALPHATREHIEFDHYDLQRNPDALMAWTSRLSSILNKSERD